MTIRRVLIVLAVLLVPAIWAFSSPPGSSPDEDFHLASIWCAQGISPGTCETSDVATVLLVPRQAVAQTCYAHNPSQSGACQEAAIAYDAVDSCDRYAFLDNPAEACAQAQGTAGLTGIWDGFANSHRSYPPYYYEFMHLFVTSNVIVSIMMIRLVNVVITATMLLLVIFLSRRSARQAVVAAAIGASIPLGLSLTGSVNPSAWGIVSLCTFWVALLEGIEQTQRKRRAALLAIAVIGLVMAIATRVDVQAFIAISIVVVLLLSPVAQKAVRRYWYLVACGVGVIALGAIVMMRVTQQWNVTPAGAPPTSEAARLLLYSNFIEISGLWTGSFGTWGIGQIDTPTPSLVAALAVPVFFFFVLFGLSKVNAGKCIALAFIVVSFLTVALWTLQGNSKHVGELVQPRYLLPLLFLLVGTAILVPNRETGLRLSHAQRHVIVGLLAVSQSLALHATMRRYITGIDFPHYNLNLGIEWWWTILPSPMLVWLVGSVAFTYLAYEALRLFTPPPRIVEQFPQLSK